MNVKVVIIMLEDLLCIVLFCWSVYRKKDLIKCI